jgi:hypothetical protein
LIENSNDELVKFLVQKKFQKRIDELAQKYKNKKVMIYGVGKAFEVIAENYDLSKLNIIGLADLKFQDGGEFHGYPTFAYDTFLKQNPDVVLIGMVLSNMAKDFFEDELYEQYGKFKSEPLIEFSLFEKIKGKLL